LVVESVRKLESIRTFDSEAWRVSTAFGVMNARPFQKRQVPSPAYILITDGGANNYENVPEPNVLFPWCKNVWQGLPTFHLGPCVTDELVTINLLKVLSTSHNFNANSSSVFSNEVKKGQ
jgi:hypothetical protein